MSLVQVKHKCQARPLKQKYEALQEVAKGAPKSTVACKYNNVPNNTLSTWIKNKDKIIQSYRECGNVKRRRVRYSPNENLDKAVYKWLLAVRSKNAVVNTLILKEKSSIFAKAFGITDFVPSDGWITRWKRRFNISFKKISGEGASCTPEMVSLWKETSLPTLLPNYDLKDIYNTNEFGLFYQMHPEKSLHLEKEQYIGGKQSKVRITGMAASNALGDKIPMFVISKSVKPRCFKEIKKKPCQYRAQKISWMTSYLFEEWVRELDRKFQCEYRKIALRVDNCLAHPDINDLKATELVFVPPIQLPTHSQWIKV